MSHRLRFRFTTAQRTHSGDLTSIEKSKARVVASAAMRQPPSVSRNLSLISLGHSPLLQHLDDVVRLHTLVAACECEWRLLQYLFCVIFGPKLMPVMVWQGFSHKVKLHTDS
jgi:hypothetical protein